MNQTKKFLQDIKYLKKNRIPENVYQRAKESLLDYFAVTFAGARFQKEKIDKYISFAQLESGDSTAFGIKQKVTLKESVFLNGLNSHALDFDDGTNAGIIHLGAPIFSLLLPLAEKYKINLERLLWASIIGYETSYTMAVSIQPIHKKLGYHATGTCGVLGATIAAAYMLEFTEEETHNAFAIACFSSSGMLKVLDEGSELKPYNVAKSALLALIALQLAKANFKSNPDPLGGSRGFFKMMTGQEEVEMKPVLQGGKYAIQKTYTKPYASCRYTHPAVEAAIHLKKRYKILPQNIERILIKTYSLAVSGHDHVNILNCYSAKMSIPFSVAVALIYGKAGIQEFTEERIQDNTILELTSRIKVIPDEEISNEFPDTQTAIVSIKTKDGENYIECVKHPKGEPENPLTKQEFKERYDNLMEYAGIDKKLSYTLFNSVFQNDISIENVIDILDHNL